MRTERQRRATPASGGDREDAGTDATVEELRRRFARFRGENRHHARVPHDLRAAVVAAVRQGVAAARLRSACGVSTSQLDRWRTARGAGVPSGSERHEARVFSVVDAPGPRGRDQVGRQSNALELRPGPWSVQVRLAEEREVRRG